MKKRFENYRRLARGLFSCSSLWAGPDHFVYVKGTGVLLPFFEEYKQFRFADVHAITMAPTRTYFWSAVIFGLGAAMSAAIIFLPDYDLENRIVMLVLFSPGLVFHFVAFVVTLARGPSCRCRIETSVGSVVIRPLGRLRLAERVLEEMSELVRGVQGGEYPEGPGDGADEVAGVDGPERAVAAPEAPPARRGGRSVFLVPTFLLLTLFGGLGVSLAYAMHWWLLPILAILDLAVVVGLVVSLVQQLRGDTPGSIIALLWTGLGQQIVILGAAFLVYVFWLMQVSMASSPAEMFSMAKFYEQAKSAGVVYYFSVINGVVSLILGLGGAALAWRYRDRMRNSAGPPALPKPETLDHGRGRE